MLSSLTLNNVALIKKQIIDFEFGFNCLLGKSGAGKSIIIEALSFCLCAKADKSLIRSGEQNLRVDAVFVDNSKDLEEFLKEQEIEFSDELIITRTLNSDGKSSVKINGFPATIKTLQSLSEILIDFCGQHESVGLLNSANHLLLLDKFAGESLNESRIKVAECFSKLSDLKTQLASLGGDDAERERTKDILKFQIKEIEDANLDLCEEEELKSRFEFLSSSEKIFEKVSDALLKLDEQRDNASALIYEAKSSLNSLSQFQDIDQCKNRLENCYYEVRDISETLNSIKAETEFDPIELEHIDARLDLIKNLKKKYGKNIEEVLNHLQKCKMQLDELENSEFVIAKINKQIGETHENLESACQELHLKREQAAEIFEKKIVAELEELDMKGTIFKVDFQKMVYTKKGFDDVKFMFSANKGQDLKDLNKTASGGELSRLLLAFKNTMLDKERVQTIVFDEIDAGISGQTAGKLAEKISNISKFTQVLCITHTPLVASRANSYLLVEKSVVGGETFSTVKSLDDDGATIEVARLFDDGDEISKTALEHAKKLFDEKR